MHRKALHLIIMALLVSGLACRRCGPADPEKGGPEGATSQGATGGGSSTRLASLAAGEEMGEAVFSEDGRHVAWVSTREGRTAVRLDGISERAVDGARRLSLHSPTGTLAFVASVGGKERVVAGSQEGPSFDEIGTLRFAPGGVAVYSARRGGAWFVRAGEREIAAESQEDPSPLVLAEGGWLVFVAGGGDGKASLRACKSDLTGCVAGDRYDRVEDLALDPAGQRIAFIAAARGEQRPVTARLERGALVETKGRAYGAVTRTTFSADGKHLAFLVERETGHALLVDGEEHAAPPMDAPLDLVAAGGRTLLTAVIQNQVAALVDGSSKVTVSGSIYFPTLTTDGAGYAFAAEADGREFVMVNGQAGPPYDKVVTPRFTPDGRQVVYRARQSGRRFVVVADAQGKTLREHPRYEAVFDVVISPDGKRVRYGVRAGDELLWKEEPL